MDSQAIVDGLKKSYDNGLLTEFAEQTAELLDQSNQASAINYVALNMLLIDKGIITPAEIEHAIVQATPLVDQEFARKREDSLGNESRQSVQCRKPN